VRGGNFIGSRGSVVPLFRRQIETGGPVTVTSSEITRFVITVQEAVALALNAAQTAVGGEIFVLPMPAVRLGVLAQAMIEALAPGNDVWIDEIGLRPGERTYELLVSEPESRRTVRQDSCLVIIRTSGRRERGTGTSSRSSVHTDAAEEPCWQCV